MFLFAQAASDTLSWPGAFLGVGICALIGFWVWSAFRRDIEVAKIENRDPAKKHDDD